MKVLLINGSPHADGCTARALKEVSDTLNQEGVETITLHIGNKGIRGCISCLSCRKTGKCVFDDEVNEAAKIFAECDGIVVGSPVYYSSPNGTLISFLDRLFYSTGYIDKRMKVGAALCSCRRGGNSSTFDVLNKYFTINQMPIASSCYWNAVHGYTKEDVEKDLEGLQMMRYLAKNMAFLMKSIQLGKEQFGLPKPEKRVWTNFHDGK